MELLRVWYPLPKVVRLKTLNQSRATTLKVLMDHREAITDALVGNDLTSVPKTLKSCD